MNKSVTKLILITCGIALAVTALFVFNNNSESVTQQRIDQNLGEDPEDKLTKAEMSANRYEYFFKKLRDPVTNSIPRDIRARELRYAKTLPSASQVNAQLKSKNQSLKLAPEFQWSLAGPPATGGRTRALGIDRRNPDIVIAGGVSGGIWKSTDGGNSWTMKNRDVQNLGVSSLAQDPNNPDTWYYTSGEYQRWSSQSATGALYFGSGVYRSNDNGETWTNIASTDDSDNIFNSKFDFISRVEVSPVSSTVFISSNAFGITRSADGNDFSDLVLGGPGFHEYADVDVSSNGTVAAVLSSTDLSADPVSNDPGIFISNDDGNTWTEITPSGFPTEYGRSVLSFAPSNPDILYVFTNKLNDDTNQGVNFYKIDLNAGTAENRSANLPDFGEPVGGVNTQGGYNMMVSVKPDNPDFVLVGATNLFRSTDGFATGPTSDSEAEKDEFWIGGYAKVNNISQTENHHVDQHVVVYDPTNPNRILNGNDGGVYSTNDVTTTEVSWNDLNDGYIVTQFYDASIPESPENSRFMGGTQDNGTTLFTNTSTSPDSTFDISSGDGGYSFFSEDFLFVSSQRGRVIRWNTALTNLDYVYPSQATDQLFIHPYAIDPNDDNIMYYPEGNHMWRNSTLGDINNDNSSGTTQGWQEITSINVPSGHDITALEVSFAPANILYFAGYNGNSQPAIRRLNNASSSTSPVNIDLPSNSNLSGAYVSDIALNPVNANEAIVVLSNYNVPSIWHTTDGGNSWENIEGNLNLQSIRSATMIPAEGGTVYVVGTSTGIYSTQQLNGTSTSWGQEGVNDLGFAVTERVDSRSNGDIAAGTHGRGMYLGSFQGSTSFPFITVSPSEAKAGETITLTSNNFDFSSTPSGNTVQFRATDIRQSGFCQNEVIEPVSAVVISASASSIEVEVPRGILPDECAISNSASISVNIQNQSPDPSPGTFSLLPPTEFALQQNFPNPFNPTTTIPINLAQDSRVTLAIYDVLGQKVMEPIFEDEFIAGSFNTSIDLSNLASGVYIYRVVATPTNGNAEPFVETRKMTLVK